MGETQAPLSFDSLKKAVRGAAAGIRLRIKLQPAGGTGAKVFPPTYIRGVYVSEERQIDGKRVPCVLLDSVQSQANRLEQALLRAYQDGKLKFPLLSVEFPEFPDIGAVTTLDAPHRIFDAILRDSTLNNLPFRPQVRAKAEEAQPGSSGGRGRRQPTAERPSARPAEQVSPEGSRVAMANVRFATPLFELCPTALLFGAWDSTGAAGGLGNKFARAIVSEIIAVNAVVGVRPASRIDPLGIEKGEVFEADADSSYVVDPAEAKKNEDGMPKVFKRKSSDRGRPSEINHSNVPPDIVKNDDGEIVGGGVTFDYADQTTVLSLAALRRLRFPTGVGKASSADADAAARTVLAALGLAAVAYQIDPPDYFLRSNCQLVLAQDPVFELVFSANRVEAFSLNASQSAALFAEAVQEAKAAGLPWREERIPLIPKKALVDLVRRSRELGGEE
jgi:CRISPR-associated protein Csb1